MKSKYNEVPVKNNMKVEADGNEEVAATVERKQMTKVVAVQPKKVKRSLFGRLVSGLVGPEGLPGIGSYVNDEIIKPAIKNIIVDAVTSGINQLMYRGETPPYRGGSRHTGHQRRDHRPTTNYNKQYSSSEPERKVVRSVNYGFDEYVLTDRMEAAHVMTTLTEAADRYGVVSIADYYDLIGVDARHTDHNYGWTIETITRATIVATRGGFLIKFPPVEVI